MATVYIITNTEGVDTFAIQPGTLNGPGGVQTNTDLRLYGMGSMLWGEGVNENFVRLTENFATPEKSGTPGTPQDENDLGPGNGVNTPLAGQLWYNTTTQTLMIYDGSTWKTSGGTSFGVLPPPTPQDGDLWYDSSIPQLMVYDGGWVSAAARYLLLDGTSPMAGDINFQNLYHAINMIDPVNPQDAATKQYVDDEIGALTSGGSLDGLYVNVIGDTMTGDLSIQSSDPNLILDDTNVGAGVGPRVNLRVNGLNRGLLHYDTASNFVAIRYYIADGLTSTSELKLSDGAAEFSTPVNIPLTPTIDAHAASKKYVDDEILALSGGGGGNLAVINPAVPKNGDIRVTTPGVIEMRQDGAWRQVYPAVYS